MRINADKTRAEFNHLVIVCDGKVTRTYVDGVELGRTCPLLKFIHDNTGYSTEISLAFGNHLTFYPERRNTEQNKC